MTVGFCGGLRWTVVSFDGLWWALTDWWALADCVGLWRAVTNFGQSEGLGSLGDLD